MKDQVDDFFSVLFPGDNVGICMSSTIYGVDVITQDQIEDADFTKFQFFSINSLKGNRKDSNVTCFRNILLEFDDIEPKKQLEIIEYIPHTTLVWSGNKSYHCIISLETPCQTREDYDRLVRRIYDRVPNADKAAKNPSRFSRTPDAMRENDRKQHLIHVRGRVTNEQLENWLGPDVRPEPSPKLVYSHIGKRLLQGSTKYFLDFGAKPGSWNRSLYLAALDMSRCELPEDEIYARLEAVTGKLDASDKRTINSALKAVRNE